MSFRSFGYILLPVRYGHGDQEKTFLDSLGSSVRQTHSRPPILSISNWRHTPKPHLYIQTNLRTGKRTHSRNPDFSPDVGGDVFNICASRPITTRRRFVSICQPDCFRVLLFHGTGFLVPFPLTTTFPESSFIVSLRASGWLIWAVVGWSGLTVHWVCAARAVAVVHGHPPPHQLISLLACSSCSSSSSCLCVCVSDDIFTARFPSFPVRWHYPPQAAKRRDHITLPCFLINSQRTE